MRAAEREGTPARRGQLPEGSAAEARRHNELFRSSWLRETVGLTAPSCMEMLIASVQRAP